MHAENGSKLHYWLRKFPVKINRPKLLKPGRLRSLDVVVVVPLTSTRRQQKKFLIKNTPLEILN
jgi:hypothetical protein